MSQPKPDPKWSVVFNRSDIGREVLEAAIISLADFRIFSGREWIRNPGEDGGGHYGPVKEARIVSLEELDALVEAGECAKPYRSPYGKPDQWYLLLETEIAKRPRECNFFTTTYGVFLQCLDEFCDGWAACRKTFAAWHKAESEREAAAAKEAKRLEGRKRKAVRRLHMDLDSLRYKHGYLSPEHPWELMQALANADIHEPELSEQEMYEACKQWEPDSVERLRREALEAARRFDPKGRM